MLRTRLKMIQSVVMDSTIILPALGRGITSFVQFRDGKADAKNSMFESRDITSLPKKQRDLRLSCNLRIDLFNIHTFSSILITSSGYLRSFPLTTLHHSALLPRNHTSPLSQSASPLSQYTNCSRCRTRPPKSNSSPYILHSYRKQATSIRCGVKKT